VVFAIASIKCFISKGTAGWVPFKIIYCVPRANRGEQKDFQLLGSWQFRKHNLPTASHARFPSERISQIIKAAGAGPSKVAFFSLQCHFILSLPLWHIDLVTAPPKLPARVLRVETAE